MGANFKSSNLSRCSTMAPASALHLPNYEKSLHMINMFRQIDLLRLSLSIYYHWRLTIYHDHDPTKQ